MLVVGVLTRPSKHEIHRAMLDTWMKPRNNFEARFVMNCDRKRFPPPPGSICTSNAGRNPLARGRIKSFEWLAIAPRMFPMARWIAKADDDVWVNVPVILRELSGSAPEWTMLGLGMYMSEDKLRFEGTFDEAWTHPRAVFPFMQGGFRVYSSDILHDRMVQNCLRRNKNVFMANKKQIGEDVLSAWSIGQGQPNRTLTLLHQTWTRFHFLQHNWETYPQGGMGWVHPTNASEVVHWLKYGSREFHMLQDTVTSTNAAFPSHVFRWIPSQHRVWPEDSARWNCYRRVCAKFGCHAPHRGASLSTYLLECEGDNANYRLPPNDNFVKSFPFQSSNGAMSVGRGSVIRASSSGATASRPAFESIQSQR